MIVGFTGTRNGLSDAQALQVAIVLGAVGELTFVHGDCVGADAQAHVIAMNHRQSRIEIRPGPDTEFRAHCWGFAMMHDPEMHFARNRKIVDTCDLLVACPPIDDWETLKRGGTVYTIRYALKTGRPVVICTPDGATDRRG